MRLLCSLGWLLASLALLAQDAPLAPRPNIIFILADDLGYGDLGCYGQKRIQTPNLDRLAAQGMRFTQVYSGSTVCAPSRSVLMTGQHTGHTRIRGNDRFPLRTEDITVAKLLNNAGYRTALIGKWGLGEPGTSGVPTRQGFDYFYGYLNQQHAHNYYPSHLWRNEQKVTLPNVVTNETATGAGVAEKRLAYSHDLFVTESLKFIQDNQRLRFFLYLALTIPHANNEAKNLGMEVPDLGDYAALDWPSPQKAHAAMITRMDRDIGRLLDLLRELKIDNQTLVFFTSDNGPHREGGNNPDFNDSNGPLRGIKRDMYEGGIRVPMLARWPGTIKPGTVSEAVWYFADVLPTLAELAGTFVRHEVDGISIAPILLRKLPGKTNRQLENRFLYWEFHENGFKQAVRWKNWKAIRLQAGAPLELYDLAHDLGETTNLASREPKVVEQIENYLKTARRDSPEWPIKTSPTPKSPSPKP